MVCGEIDPADRHSGRVDASCGSLEAVVCFLLRLSGGAFGVVLPLAALQHVEVCLGAGASPERKGV